MSDVAIVSIVSVIVTGLTALAVPRLTARAEERREARREDRERRRGDLAELRELLDQAAVEFEHAQLRLSTINRLFWGDDPGGTGAISSELSELLEHGRKARLLGSRLSIRLGDTHDAVEAHAKAAGCLGNLIAFLGQLNSKLIGKPWDLARAQAERESLREAWLRSDPEGPEPCVSDEQFVDAQNEYMRQSQRVVGSRLPANGGATN
jgi:hypothetical protein